MGAFKRPPPFFPDCQKTAARSATVFGTAYHYFFPHMLWKFHKVRSPGHVKWPHLIKSYIGCQSYTDWTIALKHSAIDRDIHFIVPVSIKCMSQNVDIGDLRPHLPPFPFVPTDVSLPALRSTFRSSRAGPPLSGPLRSCSSSCGPGSSVSGCAGFWRSTRTWQRSPAAGPTRTCSAPTSTHWASSPWAAAACATDTPRSVQWRQTQAWVGATWVTAGTVRVPHWPGTRQWPCR